MPGSTGSHTRWCPVCGDSTPHSWAKCQEIEREAQEFCRTLTEEEAVDSIDRKYRDEEMQHVEALSKPLMTDEIVELMDEDGFIKGIINVELSEVIDTDLEGFNDLVSERLVGSTLLTNISWRIVGYSDNTLLLEVSGGTDMLELPSVYRTVVDVTSAAASDLQNMLDSQSQIEAYKRDDVICTLSGNFGDGIEVDIKVCNGDSGAWIDAVLFHEGNEIMSLEPSHTLLGKFVFEHENGTYIANVKAV